MTDFGWDLPPGCRVTDIPGNRPEDEAWEHYWDEEQDRFLEVFKKVFGREPTSDEYDNSPDLYDFYEKDKNFAKVIDEDFANWNSEPPNDYRL